MKENIFIQVPEHHHHKVAIVLTVVIIGAIVFSGYMWLNLHTVPKVQNTPIDPLAARQALLMQTNPSIQLTAEQIAARQELLNKPNQHVQLSPEQIQNRRALLEN